MSAALTSGAAAPGHRAITVAALMATYMQAANISLPNAAFGLVLATRAETPLQFIAARVVQGAASGPLAPLSLAILLDRLPPARHGRISLIWTVALVLGIVSGPSIGGWLSEYHGWHSIFYFSLPITGFIFVVVVLSVPEKKPDQDLLLQQHPGDAPGVGQGSRALPRRRPCRGLHLGTGARDAGRPDHRAGGDRRAHQFKILMIAMLVVSPLVLLLRKPRPAA